MQAGMLVSWYYLRNMVARTMPVVRRVHTVLDSGAFSAASLGEHISLMEYGRFLRASGAVFDWCASLDVIGDPARSYANWLALRRSYPEVVPAVHCGADIDWVRRYLGEGASRIALGGLVPVKATLRKEDSPARRWLDGAFLALQASGVAVHGFGVTGITIVNAYPWTTIDSSSALASTRFGKVLQANGEYADAHSTGEYTESAHKIFDKWEVRRRSPTRSNRLAANLAALETFLKPSGVQTLYHAIDPSNAADLATIFNHLSRDGASRGR